MNTNGIAKHYDKLTPEERFCLILAAGSRGDLAEGDRVMNAGQRIHLTFADHAPYVDAFQELLFLTYIELLEDAALFLECYAFADTQFHESMIEATRTTKGKKTTAPRKTGRIRETDAVESQDWHHSGRAARGIGFLFKVKIEGWKMFCNRLNFSAVEFWERMDFPGVGRLKRAVGLTYAGAAFTSTAEMTIWVNEVRPAGEPERREADILTAEWFAADLYATFRERARCWGGA